MALVCLSLFRIVFTELHFDVNVLSFKGQCKKNFLKDLILAFALEMMLRTLYMVSLHILPSQSIGRYIFDLHRY